MKVNITALDNSTELKTNGMTLTVRNTGGGKFGECRVSKSGIAFWGARQQEGVRIGWKALKEICRSEESRKAALQAAKKA